MGSCDSCNSSGAEKAESNLHKKRGGAHGPDSVDSMASDSMASDSSSDSDYIHTTDMAMESTVSPSPADLNNSYSNHPLEPSTTDGYRKAVLGGNTSLVRFYFSEHVKQDLFAIRWPNGDTSLHVATRGKHRDLVSFLLNEGISANETNIKTGQTALHVAVEARDPAICRLLIQFEADVHVNDVDQISPLQKATSANDSDVIAALGKLVVHTRLLSAGVLTHMSTGRMSANIHDVLGDVDSPAAASTDPASPEYVPFHLQVGSREMVLSKDEYLSLETQHKMTMSAQFDLEKMKVASSNPFSLIKVTKGNEATLRGKMRTTEKLPRLETYLHKKGATAGWTKRWVKVTETHFFFNAHSASTVFQVENQPSIEELKRFKGAIPFNHFVAVEKLEKSKSQNKFVITVDGNSRKSHQKGKKMTWRCVNTQDCDFWIKSLRRYMSFNERE